MSALLACVALLATAWWAEREGLNLAAWAIVLLAILFAADFALSLNGRATDGSTIQQARP